MKFIAKVFNLPIGNFCLGPWRYGFERFRWTLLADLCKSYRCVRVIELADFSDALVSTLSKSSNGLNWSLVWWDEVISQNNNKRKLTKKDVKYAAGIGMKYHFRIESS